LILNNTIININNFAIFFYIFLYIMNKYRKIASRKNKTRKTLKIYHMLKNKYRKMSNKTNRSLKKNVALRNKYRKRVQIGCSRKKNMKGGGISPFQSITDAINNISHTGATFISSYNGTTNEPTPSPT